LIHKAVSSSHEGLHSIKNSHIPTMVIKLDLSRAYDKVSCLYLRLLLLHLGFSLPLVKWIMGCVTSTTFSVLINVPASAFFKTSRGFRQGCPLSLCLFLLVVERMGRAIHEAKRCRRFQGIQVGRGISITHLLFVNDVLLFYFGDFLEGQHLKDILVPFFTTTGM
jgi:hypothetical protein